jgi:hypothetical protein
MSKASSSSYHAFTSMPSIKKTIGATSLALLAIIFAGSTTPLRAQQTPAAPEKREVKQAPPQRGFGQQLVHESREVAGEEKDETGEFKQSTSVSLIAKWTGLSLRHAYWLSVLLNFALIAGVIIWASRKYLPAIFNARTAAIQTCDAGGTKGRRRSAAQAGRHRVQADEAGRGDRHDARRRGERSCCRGGSHQAAAEDDARKIVASAQQEIALQPRRRAAN